MSTQPAGTEAAPHEAGGRTTGVYFRREDYLGFVRRFLIDAIDLPIAVVLSVLALSGAFWLVPGLEEIPDVSLLILCSVWFGYFVLLKRSRFRTPGYVIMGARIVGLTGERPSISSLVARLLFVVGGPLNFVLDVLFLTGDEDRQALRDKFAGTYVVRRHASPAGVGPIVIRTYMFAGMTFLFREVKRIAADA
jgi:uncharacterized RDD family membrane protein YckC